MNVVVNGLMTNYQKVGSGRVILCLPGWADTTTSFSKLAEKLQGKYQLLILDLPGFGGTQPPPNAWGLEDYAGFVSDWLKKIDSRNIYATIGHSYGGAAAIMALSSNDYKSDRLVLLASAGVRNKKTVRKGALRVASKVAKIPLKLLPKRTRQKLRQKAYNNLGSDMLLLPHMELTYKRIIGEDVQARAKLLKLPTLLIYGTKDKDTPLEDGQILNNNISDSKLEVVDAGHFLHQERADEVAELVEGFLNNG
ncbi:MAG TPA: alpha/beta hydrolase [Candidatus Saccharimonadales bacterium]|nr:alpha/beta hydrolase [Candidatus Saccharimonadales bacterium]